MQDKLKDLFDRAVELVAENGDDTLSAYVKRHDADKDELHMSVTFDDIDQDIALQFQKADQNGVFDDQYDRIYLTSSVSEVGTIITDQSNTAFEDEESVSRVVEEIYTQIINPLSNVLDVLMAQEAVDSEDYGQWI